MLEIFQKVADGIEAFRNEWRLLCRIREDSEAAPALDYISSLPQEAVATIRKVPDAVVMTAVHTDNTSLFDKVMDTFAGGNRNLHIKRTMLGTHISGPTYYTDVLDFALESGSANIARHLIADNSVRVQYHHLQTATRYRAPSEIIESINARFEGVFRAQTGQAPEPELARK